MIDALFQKERDKLFLVLDIGTEAVKALIFSDSQEGAKEKKITVLGAGLEYFGKYDVFNKGDFKTDLIKRTILKAIENARQNVSFSIAKKELKREAQKQRSWQVLLGLPPNILKARVVCQSFLRSEPKEKISKKEKENICQHIFELAKKEISQKIAKEFGILANDIDWLKLEILKTEIDGYPVSDFRGYQGKKLEFEILVSFLPKHYLKNIERIIAPLKLEIFKIVHIAEGLSMMSKKRKKDGLFLDIGGEITQIFEIKSGQLQWIGEFKKGGNAFIESLSQTLGVDEDTARSLERRYSEKSLSPEVSKKIKEIFLWEKKIWYDKLKEKLERANLKSSAIFIFGGGSFLSDLQDVLKENPFFSTPPKVDFIYLEDLISVINTTKGLNSYQYIPSLLLTYA